MKNFPIAMAVALLFIAGRNLLANEPDRVDLEKMIPFTIEQLASASDLVVRGIVEEVTVKRDASKRIYTEITMEPLDYWKGSGPAKKLVVVQGGGTLGEERVEVSGQPKFLPGEEAVLFLALNPRKEPVVYAMSQGKFAVAVDPSTGAKVAWNPFHGSPPAKAGQKKAAAPALDGSLLTL